MNSRTLSSTGIHAVHGLSVAEEVVDGGWHDRHGVIAITLSAVTLGNRWAVHQRVAQRRPGEGQYEIITRSFGNP
jgi:hypothetical protein